MDERLQRIDKLRNTPYNSCKKKKKTLHTEPATKLGALSGRVAEISVCPQPTTAAEYRSTVSSLRPPPGLHYHYYRPPPPPPQVRPPLVSAQQETGAISLPQSYHRRRLLLPRSCVSRPFFASTKSCFQYSQPYRYGATNKQNKKVEKYVNVNY